MEEGFNTILEEIALVKSGLNGHIESTNSNFEAVIGDLLALKEHHQLNRLLLGNGDDEDGSTPENVKSLDPLGELHV